MRLRYYAILAAVLFTVYYSNRRSLEAADSLPAALLPFSVLLDGQVSFDRFTPWIESHPECGYAFPRVSGHYYSLYPIAGPLLTTPLYAPVVALRQVRQLPPAALVGLAKRLQKYVAMLLTVATALLLLALLERIVGLRSAFWLALAFGLGSELWSISSQGLWQHSYGGLAIAACLYATDRWNDPGCPARWRWATGLACAVAIAVRPTNVVLLAATAAALWGLRQNWRAWLPVMLPVLGAGLAVLAYNQAVFATAAGGYHLAAGSLFQGRFRSGFTGLLFSPGRGLFIYTPMVLFGACVGLPAARAARRAHRPLLVAASVMALLHLIVVSNWRVWWGGFCWGPRLLTELLPSAAVLVALGWPALGSAGRRAFGCAVVYSVLLQGVGAFFAPNGAWDTKPTSVDVSPERLWDWRDNPVIRSIRGGIVKEPFMIFGSTWHPGERAPLSPYTANKHRGVKYDLST
jgi:hypothetical protein